MPDRIKKTNPNTPHKPLPAGHAALATMTQIPITIAPKLLSINVNLETVGNNAQNNGVFKINDHNGSWQDKITLNGLANWTIGLPGITQTRVPSVNGKFVPGGNAGNLKLKVAWGWQSKLSGGFSVAAIPVKVEALALHWQIRPRFPAGTRSLIGICGVHSIR